MATSSPWKTGLVSDVLDVPNGLREWRFVPTGWVSPLPHLAWFVVTDETEIAKWKEILAEAPRITWYVPGPADYTAEISFDAKIRPELVLVGGFR